MTCLVLPFITLLSILHANRQEFYPQMPGLPYCDLKGKAYIEENPKKALFKVYEEESEAFADFLVFETDNSLFADKAGIWCFIDNRGLADFSICFVDSKSQADFSIYYTTYESMAGCTH
jgi:hypothetical protein